MKESLASAQLRLLDFSATPIQPTPDSPLVGRDVNPQTQKFLQSLLADAHGDLEKFKILLEKWFDSTMERATGWYKKYTQTGLLITGFIIAIAFNVDTIAIVNKLSTDPRLREQMVQSANAYVQSHQDTGAGQSQLSEELMKRRTALLLKADTLLNTEIRNVNDVIGLGWKNGFGNFDDVQKKQGGGRIFLGWLVTALALSLGAPFWFDLLNKLVKMRGTGKKVETGSSAGLTTVSVQPNITVNTNSGEEAVG